MEEIDPNDKNKRQSPIKGLVKFGLIVLGLVGVIAAVRLPKNLAVEQKEETSVITKSVGATIDHEEVERVEVKSAASPKGPEPVISSDATEEFPDEPLPDSSPGLPFSPNRPVLVLSLPHNADLAVGRYFQCGGVATHQIGRYWSVTNDVPLGQCFHNNMRHNTTMKLHCGDFAVYSDLQFWEPSRSKGIYKHDHYCFDPVLYPKALEELYQSFPNAIVLTIQQDSKEWFYSLPRDLKIYWRTHCNPTHQNKFPSSTKSLAQFQEFWHDYHMAIVAFAQHHEGWEYLHIDLHQDVDIVARRLESELKIPAQCWKDSFQAPLKNGADPAVALRPQNRPNTIPYPILDISMSKSGSAIVTHNYFRCGLGSWVGATQWTTPSASTLEKPLEDLPIGQCIKQNVNSESSDNILKGCGRARVWGDIGYIRDNLNGGTCYYPTMDSKAMEEFAKYYPNATLLHVVRDASEWFESATKNNNLPNRWAAAINCRGFPATGDNKEEWVAFYNDYTQKMRAFAAAHPTLTYLEIPMSAEGGKMLQEIFRFPDRCWPKTFPDDY